MNESKNAYFLLVMSVSMKWFFTFGAHEVLDVPVLAQSCDNTFFYRTTTRATNRNSHFIVTSKTIQFFLYYSRV
jgi:hypothetical protein